MTISDDVYLILFFKSPCIRPIETRNEDIIMNIKRQIVRIKEYVFFVFVVTSLPNGSASITIPIIDNSGLSSERFIVLSVKDCLITAKRMGIDAIIHVKAHFRSPSKMFHFFIFLF